MSTTIGCVTGVFDLFQVAHLDLLRRAAERCDRLVVIVPSDLRVQALGLPRPIVPYDERAAIVREMAGVDEVAELVDDDLADRLRGLAVDVLVSHPLDLPGTRDAALALDLTVETVQRLRMSASELLRFGRFASDGDNDGDADSLYSVA